MVEISFLVGGFYWHHFLDFLSLGHSLISSSCGAPKELNIDNDIYNFLSLKVADFPCPPSLLISILSGKS